LIFGYHIIVLEYCELNTLDKKIFSGWIVHLKVYDLSWLWIWFWWPWL